MKIQQLQPYIFNSADRQVNDSYFDYPATVHRVKELLTELYDSPMHLYMQEDGDDVWDWVSDDLRSGLGGVRKVAAV